MFLFCIPLFFQNDKVYNMFLFLPCSCAKPSNHYLNKTDFDLHRLRAYFIDVSLFSVWHAWLTQTLCETEVGRGTSVYAMGGENAFIVLRQEFLGDWRQRLFFLCNCGDAACKPSFHHTALCQWPLQQPHSPLSMATPAATQPFVNGHSSSHTALCQWPLQQPPRWPSGSGVCLESIRSPVRIPLVPGFFSGSSHTSDSKIGTPVATLPGAWRYRVSPGTGRSGVSILWLGEVERLICNFYLSVAARKIVWADPSLRYTCMLLGR